MSSPLRISFLGPPTVIHQGRILKFPTRKTLALLVYLVITGEPHSRTHLRALLWPESDAQHGGASLRSALTRLRHTLAPAGDFILIQAGGEVAFDFTQPYTLDLDLLEKAMPPDAPPHVLQAALAAAHGEFLEGFSLPDAPDFDLWIDLERETQHIHLEIIYERLTHYYLTAGKWEEALDVAHEWLIHSPLSEAAHRALMKAYSLAGDRTSALHVYDRCVQMLRREFDLKPATETVLLAQSIKNLQSHDLVTF